MRQTGPFQLFAFIWPRQQMMNALRGLFHGHTVFLTELLEWKDREGTDSPCAGQDIKLALPLRDTLILAWVSNRSKDSWEMG